MRGRGMVPMGGFSFWFRRPLPYHSGKAGWRTALNFYDLRDNLSVKGRDDSRPGLAN